MNPRVKSVIAQENYTLLIRFTNDEQGIFDVSPLLEFPVFQVLKDESVFSSVHVGNGNTVCWGNDLDICPDTIYEDSVKI